MFAHSFIKWCNLPIFPFFRNYLICEYFIKQWCKTLHHFSSTMLEGFIRDIFRTAALVLQLVDNLFYLFRCDGSIDVIVILRFVMCPCFHLILNVASPYATKIQWVMHLVQCFEVVGNWLLNYVRGCSGWSTSILDTLYATAVLTGCFPSCCPKLRFATSCFKYVCPCILSPCFMDCTSHVFLGSYVFTQLILDMVRVHHHTFFELLLVLSGLFYL